MKIIVDADGCPVKQEIRRVAQRYSLEVVFVANSSLTIPAGERASLIVVGRDFDAADDWIAEHVEARDIVVTNDIPLAARVIGKDARVLTPSGRELTDDSIGEALARRDLLSQLRDLGTMSGGPPPFEKRQRSTFLARLDEVIQKLRRGK
jgi:uncharacterized protein YaiI (UPF0178 family)